MCAQDRSHSPCTCHIHGGSHLATSTHKPALSRMPKIACLATAVCFTRALTTVSARIPSHAVSQPAHTLPVYKITLCNQPTTSSVDFRPALAVSNDPTCRHRRSHAFVKGRWIPFCLRCGHDKKTDDSPAVVSSLNVDAKTIVAASSQAVLQTMQGFPFDLRRSRVEAGRLTE